MPGILDGPNLYTYVEQNPWSRFDPDGQAWSAIITAGFAIYDTYQYATGKTSGKEYAAAMALNGAALVADVATAGNGGGLAVRAANVAIKAAKVVDKADTLYSTANGAYRTGKAIAEGDGEGAVVNGVLTAIGAKASTSGSKKPGGSPEGTTPRAQSDQLDAPEVQAQLKAAALAKGDTYGHLADHPSVGPGKDFTPTALEKAKAENLQRNGGVMRDDVTGELMTPHPATTKGSTVPPSAVQGDHVIPKKPKDPNVAPGSNSFQNLKLRRAEHNRQKSNN